jgi:protease I
MKKIAMIIAPSGFQDLEFNTPLNYFQSRGAMVDIYSTVKGIAQGKLGMKVRVEKILSELDVKNYDAIVYIGGPGTPIVRSDDESTRVASEAYNSGKIIGAICWSPTILGKAGILKGKKVTVWKGKDEEYKKSTEHVLKEYGAKVENDPVVIDGKIITADGPASAILYAEAIWKTLQE